MKSYYIKGGSGTKLFVNEGGNPYGVPILFVHSLSQSRMSWIKQLSSYSLKKFRLIAFDLRGHGLSDKPHDGYHEAENWAEDINSIISYLELHKPLLVGWSYGGKVVCDYIKIYGEDNISGINLVDAGTSSSVSGGTYYTPAFQDILPGFISTDALTSSDTLQQFVNLLFYINPPTRDFYYIFGYNMVVPPYVREAIVTRTASYDELLSTIKKPVLLTHGLQDKILYSTQSIYNSSLIANPTVSLYNNTGHSPFWEKTSRFNHELASFAKKCTDW